MSILSPSATARLLLLLLAGSACSKVPLVDIEAGFALADASWFAEEETLFVFYEAAAEQGLGEASVIEITYSTDEERVPWTAIADLPSVHTHLDVDCGETGRCGSTSLHVPLEPRNVEVRLRYHRDGELALDADTVLNVVGPGPPHSNRSLIVYGVFDERNERIQWRGRHQFPTIRNQQATRLGLRRDIVVEEQVFGAASLASSGNPYGYGVTCPEGFTDAGQAVLETDERAAFNADLLPLAASDAPVVCAQATVTDAIGTFTTGAIAQKNPEVRPAFPLLRSPIHDAVPLRFFLGPCNRTISEEHEDMQRQRLQLGSRTTYCIDDWDAETFVDRLTADLSAAIEAQRVAGEDMVLVIGLHQDERGVARAVAQALARVVPPERHRSTPRLVGAFVFDSDATGLPLSELSSSTLWCPATLSLDDPLANPASLACAILPDNFNIDLGPFSFGTLPILPTRTQYLEFIDTYSERQAGSVQTLAYRTPEFAVTSDHIDIGDYGVATFLNGEVITADLDDAFSYCAEELSYFFVFRSPFMQSELFAKLIAEQCEEAGLSEDVCAAAELGLLPIEYLGDWHSLFGESTYDLGIYWDFPFLLRMEYEAVVAGSVSAFGLSVPFGFAGDAETYYGTEMWTTDTFPLADALTQCTRFCDHPTFDAAGVYHVTDPFRSTYRSACYQPLYPVLGDAGFPRDP